MAIPDFQTLMLPLLDTVSDGGEQLAELMIEHGIGVPTTRTYALKKIDSDYFVEDEA